MQQLYLLFVGCGADACQHSLSDSKLALLSWSHAWRQCSESASALAYIRADLLILHPQLWWEAGTSQTETTVQQQISGLKYGRDDVRVGIEMCVD